MLKIKYEARAFPKSLDGKELNGTHTLSTDWHEIIWAAITVGKRNSAQISSHGIYSIYEIINRSTLVWSNLKQNSNHLEQTTVYRNMDPTEKVFVSFSLGMVMSKLFALKLLEVSWLEHVANVNSSITTKTQTKSRPDLIGLNARGDYVIFEAKGRTNSFDQKAQITAKEQTKVIDKIGAIKPILRVACQSYFKNVLEVRIEDPEEIQEESIDIEVSEKEYFQLYYSLFQRLTEQELELLKPVGIEIGFTDTLIEALKSREFKELTTKTKEPYFDNNGFKCFPDGLKIKLNPELWSEQTLEMEPEQR